MQLRCQVSSIIILIVSLNVNIYKSNGKIYKISKMSCDNFKHSSFISIYLKTKEKGIEIHIGNLSTSSFLEYQVIQECFLLFVFHSPH